MFTNVIANEVKQSTGVMREIALACGLAMNRPRSASLRGPNGRYGHLMGHVNNEYRSKRSPRFLGDLVAGIEELR